MNTPPLDQAWIAAHIPHQGRMCLLRQVLHWNEQEILCQADSHRDPAHPLLAGGRLGAACGVEYAAQAMALHGALLSEQRGVPRPRRGLLVSVRGVTLHVPRLDDVAGEITVAARCEAWITFRPSVSRCDTHFPWPRSCSTSSTS